jgi:MFS family permease
MTVLDAPAAGAPAAADATERSRWIALVVLCVGMLMIVLDATVVNVALPSIQDDLGFSQSSLAWVVNAYLIAFGGLLLLAGRLGDLVSRRGVFLAGLGVFTLASLLCGTAQSQAMLVAARFVQGVGGALTSAVILGMIVTMFPEPREQAKAIGIYSFVASAGGSVGLLAGGVLTQAVNWHWIFFLNLPIGIACAVLATRLLPRDTGAGLGRGADVPGAVLITGALMTLVYTIVEPAAKEAGARAPPCASAASPSRCSPPSCCARPRPASRSSRCVSSARARCPARTPSRRSSSRGCSRCSSSAPSTSSACSATTRSRPAWPSCP